MRPSYLKKVWELVLEREIKTRNSFLRLTHPFCEAIKDTGTLVSVLNILPKLKIETFFQRCSAKKMFLEISQNSQENTCARVFFKKIAGLRPATLLKKRLWHRCFPVNFAKFLRTPFLTEHFRWLLLFYDDRVFLLSRWRLSSFLNFMKTWANATKATLREAWHGIQGQKFIKFLEKAP